LGFACGFVGWMSASIAWMHWSFTDEFVIGFKSVEELYPSSPLGVDSADTSQLPQENNLLGQIQYFQIDKPGSSTIEPLFQQRRQ
jgi:hypothetical protein